MNLKKTLLVGSLFCGVYVFPLYAETPYSESETIEQQKGIRVSGTVIDKEKNTLPGVNIMVKGSSGGTITDIDGHFYIEVPDKSSILVITYVGFKTQEIPVGNNINFNITLLEDVEALDEVVVVGYGNQKKLSVIGSVQTLEPAKLQVGSSRSMSNNLAGQLAGVIAVQPSGEPGYDNSNFWIRGISSFSGNTSPLVLVDGVERSLNDIDPAEIESFSVLKDASASAMYGVRGANGVILINTKRGSVSAPSVNLRVEQSIQAPTKLPQFIGAAEYMSLLNTLQSDPNKRLFTKDQILKTYYGYDKDLYPDVDWIDAITKDYANSTRANLTVSGGTEILRYSLTASLYHENGIMGSDKTLPYDTQSKLNRYNIRANVDLDLTKTTLLRFNVGGYLQNLRKSRSSTDELFQAAFETPPFVHPAVYSDGTIPRVSNTRKNPWAMNTQNGYYRGGKSKLESLFSLEQNLKMITPGLKMKVTFAFDTYNENFVTRGKEPDYYSVAKSRNDEGELVHSILSYGSEFLDHSSNANYGNQSTYLEAAVTYNRTFDKHALDALFLYNQRSYDWGDVQPNRTQGIAGRLSYTFDRRYISEFNFGYNGSERFYKNERWGFFPAAGLAWVISNEKFWRPMNKVIPKLKLKATYGLVGNDAIGDENDRFFYLSEVDPNDSGKGYWFGTNFDEGKPGVTVKRYDNRLITWERAKKANYGLELTLFDALNIQLDYFTEHRTNILMDRASIPADMGLAAKVRANVGEAKARGLDLSLDYNKAYRNGMWLQVHGNFTYAHSEFLKYEEPEYNEKYKLHVGQSLNQEFGYIAERLFIDDADVANSPKQTFGEYGAGDIKYRDVNGDGQITELDQVPIGFPTVPEIIYGFGFSFGSARFDVSAFFQGSARSSFWIDAKNTSPFVHVYEDTNWDNAYMWKDIPLLKAYADNHWTETNRDIYALWPRLSTTRMENNIQKSTWFMRNGAFLRMKTLEVGYTFPETLTKKAYINSARIYCSGNNLFVLSGFSMWDIEMGGNGLGYPIQRVINIGVQLTF